MDHHHVEQVRNSLNNFSSYVVSSTGKVLFASTTIVNNSGDASSIADLPFEHLIHSKNHVINEEWHRCLSLKKGDRYQFEFLSGNNSQVLVFATGLGNEGGGEPAVLLQVALKEEAVTNGEVTANELEALRQKQIEFIDHAAHDLHSPVRKLSTFIGKLEEQCANEDTKALVGRITSNLVKLKDLIDGFTELARAGEAGIHFTVCNTENLVREVVEEFEEELREKGIRLEVSSLPQLECDENQIRTLFRNLLENAIKFSRKDEPGVIKIFSLPLDKNELTGLNQNRKYAKLIVEDNGIGFDPRYSETIFEPFRKMHSVSGIMGNGLGLAISRRIVHNHEGRIMVHSNGNNGASFALFLPIPEKTEEHA